MGGRRKQSNRQRIPGDEPHAIRKPDGQSFALGYHAGYARGHEEGRGDFGKIFEGTSIIIPTYNKKELLEKCLDSIQACTTHPYEIIVVDDASGDGTIELLRTRRSIRAVRHEQNTGFAGAVNTGLMMAKGETVVIMNNDVLVTENWLDNLLRCLNSSPDIGAVGPVTNYIGGEQEIEVPYVQLDGLQAFAAAHNRPDPGKWRETGRLVGFCLLMKRQTVLQTGYFDEGYRVGNYEDDDWMIRLTIQGFKLMIAGDAFVHHIGSATMKSLNTDDFEHTTTMNRDYFHRKWGEGDERFRKLGRIAGRIVNLTSSGFPDSFGIPTQVLVCSSSGRVYWLEDGMRFLISDASEELKGFPPVPPVRIPVTALAGIPLAGEWNSEQLRRTVEEVYAVQPTGAPIRDGVVYRTGDDRLEQLDRGLRREIWSGYAAEAWGLMDRIRPLDPAQLEAYLWGSPILPPAVLHSPIL